MSPHNNRKVGVVCFYDQMVRVRIPSLSTGKCVFKLRDRRSKRQTVDSHVFSRKTSVCIQTGMSFQRTPGTILTDSQEQDTKTPPESQKITVYTNALDNETEQTWGASGFW